MEEGRKDGKYTNWTSTKDDEEGGDKRISTSTRQHRHSTTQHNTIQSLPRPGVIVRSDSERTYLTRYDLPPCLSPEYQLRSGIMVHGAHIKQSNFLSFSVGVIPPSRFRQQNYNEWINCLLLWWTCCTRGWTGAWVHMKRDVWSFVRVVASPASDTVYRRPRSF